MHFIQIINLSNNLHITRANDIHKVFIGKGNNFNVIKDCFRKRWWWKV